MELLIFDGIKKTINRFRKNPFFYLSKTDIISSLQRDILKIGAKELYFTEEKNKIYVSLVHLKYPTNFKYEKEKLLEGYENVISITSINSPHDHGSRGCFDLAVLNSEFIKSLFNGFSTSSEPGIYDLKTIMKNVINKDASFSIQRKQTNETSYQKEILYAVEVKFIHQSNSKNIENLEEVIMDNEKLRLAAEHSKWFMKPVNLVFCSVDTNSGSENNNLIVNRIKEYIENGKIEYKGKIYEIPKGVANIFIKSSLNQVEKPSPKPITWPAKDNADIKDWQKELIGMFIK